MTVLVFVLVLWAAIVFGSYYLEVVRVIAKGLGIF